MCGIGVSAWNNLEGVPCEYRQAPGMVHEGTWVWGQLRVVRQVPLLAFPLFIPLPPHPPPHVSCIQQPRTAHMALWSLFMLFRPSFPSFCPLYLRLYLQPALKQPPCSSFHAETWLGRWNTTNCTHCLWLWRCRSEVFRIMAAVLVCSSAIQRTLTAGVSSGVAEDP